MDNYIKKFVPHKIFVAESHSKVVKFIYSCLLFVVLTALFLNFNYAYAGLLEPHAVGELTIQEDEFAKEAGFNINTSVGDVVALVIKAFLGLLGVIFVILIIIAGHKWMTAGGNEDKIKEAKIMISRAIIGLIIIIAAYGITYFVFTNLDFIGTGSGLGGS